MTTNMRLQDLETQAADEGLDSFYISFGDLMVILCVFLVMLLSMSKIEVGSFEKVKQVMTGNTENTLVALHENLEDIIQGVPGVPGASVVLAEQGVRVDLDTSILFAPGEAIIDQQALLSIDRVLRQILETDYLVDIEGHSDDVAYYKVVEGEVSTNWTLSGKRAGSMALHMLGMGFPKQRLRTVGYADTRPVVDPSNKQGEALAEARQRNRRVSLLIR